MKITLDTSTLPRPPRWAVALAVLGLIAGAVLFAERAREESERQARFVRCMRLAELIHHFSEQNDTEQVAQLYGSRRRLRCE